MCLTGLDTSGRRQLRCLPVLDISDWCQRELRLFGDISRRQKLALAPLPDILVLKNSRWK